MAQDLHTCPVYDNADRLDRWDVLDYHNMSEDGDPACIASFVGKADAELFCKARLLLDTLRGLLETAERDGAGYRMDATAEAYVAARDLCASLCPPRRSLAGNLCICLANKGRGDPCICGASQ